MIDNYGLGCGFFDEDVVRSIIGCIFDESLVFLISSLEVLL